MAPLLHALHALLALLGSPTSSYPVPQSDQVTTIQTQQQLQQVQQQQPNSHPALPANLDPPQRRDFVWTELHDSPQDLCGDSTFSSVVTTTATSSASSSGGGGGGGGGDDDPPASAADCRELVFYAASRPGFWLVTGFGASGLSWVEFDVLGACKMAVRHADGGGGAIPIGNTDVIDLINSTIAMFSSGGDDLPQVKGIMTCSQTSTAVVEWKLYGE